MKHYTKTFHQAQSSYFWRVMVVHIYMHRVLADSNIFSILESYFKSKQKSTHSLEMQISELDFELKNQKGSRS